MGGESRHGRKVRRNGDAHGGDRPLQAELPRVPVKEAAVLPQQPPSVTL